MSSLAQLENFARSESRLRSIAEIPERQGELINEYARTMVGRDLGIRLEFANIFRKTGYTLDQDGVVQWTPGIKLIPGNDLLGDVTVQLSTPTELKAPYIMENLAFSPVSLHFYEESFLLSTETYEANRIVKLTAAGIDYAARMRHFTRDNKRVYEGYETEFRQLEATMFNAEARQLMIWAALGDTTLNPRPGRPPEGQQI